jgi:hypothetical protein
MVDALVGTGCCLVQVDWYKLLVHVDGTVDNSLVGTWYRL